MPISEITACRAVSFQGRCCESVLDMGSDKFQWLVSTRMAYYFTGTHSIAGSGSEQTWASPTNDTIVEFDVCCQIFLKLANSNPIRGPSAMDGWVSMSEEIRAVLAPPASEAAPAIGSSTSLVRWAGSAKGASSRRNALLARRDGTARGFSSRRNHLAGASGWCW